MNVKRIKQSVITLILANSLVACSSLPALDEIVKDNREKYQKATVLPPLDVPPDLSTARINDEFSDKNDGTTYVEYDTTAANPLAAKYNAALSTKPALIGEGINQYLLVQGDEDLLWQRMMDFWESEEITVKRYDQAIGMMDTEADADGYAYRTRVEAADTPNALKMFIGAANFGSDDRKNEAKLRQLADYMGNRHLEETRPVVTAGSAITANPRQAVASPAAQLETNPVIVDEASDHQALRVDREFDWTWRRVGTTVDSKYFVVQDREQDKGVYFVQYLDPFLLAKNKSGGMIDSLAFWRDDMDRMPELFYYIKLIEDGGETKIIILDIDQVRTSSPSARRLLRLLQEQLAR